MPDNTIFDRIREKAQREAEAKKPPSLKEINERFNGGKIASELNRRFGTSTEQPIEPPKAVCPNLINQSFFKLKGFEQK